MTNKLTPRTWAEKQAEKELTARALDGSPIAWAAHLLIKEHARAVRLVKAEIKRVKLDQYSYNADEKCVMVNSLETVLAALQRGRTGRGK